ncbi:MAG: hypothetical protein ABSG86_02860 [Thermoguttaceae bacterium]
MPAPGMPTGGMQFPGMPSGGMQFPGMPAPGMPTGGMQTPGMPAGGVPVPGPGVSSGLPFQLPPSQPLSFGPGSPGTAPGAAPGGQSAPEKPRGQFVLPFDPTEKASLPFEMPGGPEPSSAAPGGMPGAGQPLDQMPSSETSPEQEEFAPVRRAKRSKAIGVPELEDEIQPKQMHIPCPSGHPLEVASEMLGKTAECPLCGKRFRLRYEDSLEFRRRKAKLLEKQDAKSGQIWLAWAILAAVVVLGLLVAMAMLMS